MALVGSGTSKIKNFALAASLSSADVDESLAAFVEQLGGVKWLNGASDRAAGNLTYDNFATAPSLPNHYKREPNGRFCVSFRWSQGAGATTGKYYVGSFRAPRACALRFMFGSVAGDLPVCTYRAYVDGVQVAETTFPGATVVPVVASVPAGSIVAVEGDATGVSIGAGHQVMVVLQFASEHE